MDAFAFCIVACLVIGAIALFVRIFNKGKSLPHARAKECYGGSRTFLQSLRMIISPVIFIIMNLITISGADCNTNM